MSSPHFFHRLHDDLEPSAAARDRVRSRVMQKMHAPRLLYETRRSLAPDTFVEQRVWQRVSGALGSQRVPGLLTHARDALAPAPLMSRMVWQRLVPALVPVAPAASRGVRLVKLTAAFAVVALAVHISPMLLLIPSTEADSRVILLSTRGDTAVAIGGLWQTVESGLALEQGTTLRTASDAEASILFHDDAVIRLDSNTVITLRDAADRLDTAADATATFELKEGRVWVQGLVPAHVRGMTVATSAGTVTVQEGSVTVERRDEDVSVAVYNRRAAIDVGEEHTVLVRGERADLRSDGRIAVRSVSSEDEDSAWVRQNLDRDAVHRREIAQMQQERRAARAHILPTSPLYPVKRVAEKVDVLLTLDERTRVEKQIGYANVRLDEAAALLEEGDIAAVAQPLQEYRESLASVATGSGGSSVAHILLEQAVSQASADTAASLPGDDSYLIKRAVLEASASLADHSLSDRELRVEILMETLSAVAALPSEHDTGDALPIVQETLAMISEDTHEDLSPDLQKEAHATLTRIARNLAKKDLADRSESERELLASMTSYLPAPPPPAVVTLSSEELASLIQTIWDRIYLYRMPQSRINQLHVELAALRGHPEEGRILRALYQEIPAASDLSDLIRRAIVQLRWEKAAQN